MAFLPAGTSTCTTYTQPNFNVAVMKYKAAEFSGNDADLLKFIHTILDDTAFQNNPRKYLDDWRDRRNFTAEFRLPEDSARGFFCRFFGHDRF